MKNVILPIAMLVTILCCYLIVNANQTVQSMQETLDKERYQRMVAEEKLQKQDAKLSLMKRKLETSRSKMDKIQAILAEGEAVKADLEVELQTIKDQKISLEQKIQEIQFNETPKLQF